MRGGNTVLDGIVLSGLGEGHHFVSLDHYKKEIKEKLGFDAYHGTLNIKIDKHNLNALKNNDKTKIEGFKKDGKAFGSIQCYKAKINNINGSIIIPEFTKHKEEIIEFIAPVHVKSE